MTRLVRDNGPLVESLSMPLARSQMDLATFYEQMFAGDEHLDVISVNRDLLVEGGRIGSLDQAVRLPDWIRLAAPATCARSAVLSGDKLLALPEGMRVGRLSETGLANIMGSPG